MKKNDRSPARTLIFKRPDEDGVLALVDITSSTITAIAKIEGSATSKWKNTLTITDATNGEARLDFGSGDLDTVGRYLIEVTITWEDGTPETCPHKPIINVGAEYPDP